MVRINMNKEMKKRGQVTIFIIIAILVVGALLSFFLWAGPTYFSGKSGRMSSIGFMALSTKTPVGINASLIS